MLKIKKDILDAMLVQLSDALPLEACGLIAGNDGQAEHLYPVANMLSSPFEYEMEPQEQLEAFLDLEERGWELLAIYHSHPHGPEYPSTKDVSKAYYPEAAQLIVSFKDRDRPLVRAFLIAEGLVSEVPFQIV